MSSWDDASRLGCWLESAAGSGIARGLRAGVEADAIFFASLATSCRKMGSRRLLGLRCFARFADWIVLGHGTNVTRVTRGENLLNNKI